MSSPHRTIPTSQTAGAHSQPPDPVIEPIVPPPEDAFRPVTPSSDTLRMDPADLNPSVNVTRQSSTPSLEGCVDDSVVKRQYEAKLKDVMDKARDHARKIAGERDEFRRQLLDRDKEVAKLTKRIQANASVATAGTVQNLELRLQSMEKYYTVPPVEFMSDPLCVVDEQGVQWTLLTETSAGSSEHRRSWWKRELVDQPSAFENSPTLSLSSLKHMTTELQKLRRELTFKSAEFDEYKSKAQSLLVKKQSDELYLPHEDLTHVSRVMELEGNITKLTSRITALEARNSELEKNEKSLKSQVKNQSTELSTLSEQLNCMRAENDSLADAVQNARTVVPDLAPPLSPSSSPVSPYSTLSADSPPMEPPSTFHIATQTDTIVRSESIKTSPSLPATSHDAVVIPLRQQIRDLLDELESEKRFHALTQNQLDVVKEEFRKLSGEYQLGADLVDPVKVEYMRNVGRKFISLIPKQGDEFENLLSVVLPFFQISSEEISRILEERRVTGSSSFSIKLW
jgi:hypothetical protein